MAAGSGPVRTSIRPNTLSTVFFITAIGLIQTVMIGTTCTDTIANNQTQAQRELSHERVSAPSQTGRPSLLDAFVKPAGKRQTTSPSITETSPQTKLLGDTVYSMPSSPPREKLSSPSQLHSSLLSSRPHPSVPFECGGVELISLVCGVLTCMHVQYIGIRVRVSFSSNETKTRGGTLALCCGASTLQA